MLPSDVTRLSGPLEQKRHTMRPWLRLAHEQLAGLLPARSRPALLTEQLSEADGRPADVFKHFNLKFEDMDSLLGNLDGLLHTAHLSATTTHTGSPPPPWPGFEDLWIPVTAGVELSGRLGLARDDGEIREADCIVILPGLFGDNGVLRTRDLALAFRDRGFHVLALELRACGQTERRYPNAFTCWGVRESADLLDVAEWLEDKPHVRRTGLVGFCWGANIALLTAWADSRSLDDPSVTAEVNAKLPPPNDRLHYQAGIMAFSPLPRIEELRSQLDRPRSALFDPVLHAFQNIIRDRMIAKGHEPVSGSLRQLIAAEIAGSDPAIAVPVPDGLRYLRLLQHGAEPDGGKLERARVPTLVVHSANDPLIPACDIADLISQIENPNVAGIILPGGGHVGLVAYAREYYFSLIMNFFDSTIGPVATP